MSLPRIPNPNPIATQPNYNDLFLTYLEIRTDAINPLTQKAQIQAVPYDQTTGTIFPYEGAVETHLIPNIWEEAQRSTLFAQALGAVVQYFSLAMAEKIAIRDNDTESLTTIHAAMGVE
jgi:hypothetical protein